MKSSCRRFVLQLSVCVESSAPLWLLPGTSPLMMSSSTAVRRHCRGDRVLHCSDPLRVTRGEQATRDRSKQKERFAIRLDGPMFNTDVWY
ncbi:unnamed protein product, partial [Iphiclides podalirius]